MIVAADTGSALLNEDLEQVKTIATACVATQYPFAFAEVHKGIYVLSRPEDRENIVTEAQLCLELAVEVKPAEVHLDISLGGAEVSKLNDQGAWLDRLSEKGREALRAIIPRIRDVAKEIEERTSAKVLAIGKKSPAVRVAELTAGAYGMAYAIKRAVSSGEDVYVGLPKLCSVEVSRDFLFVRSLKEGERCFGFINVDNELLEAVRLYEFNNPHVEGFKVVKISLRK